MDLNVEAGGEIEQPIKPAMRFAVAVYDSREIMKGILVSNYPGQRLLRDFNRAAANIADHNQRFSRQQPEASGDV